MNTNTKPINIGLLFFAFASIYIIWGSTYIAIRFAIETMPPFLMAGSRFFIAGVILYVIALITGAPKPSAKHVKASFIIGFLLLVCGNGGVVWAEKSVSSSMAALIVTIEPLWVVLLMWVLNNDKKPSWFIWAGLLLGAVGMYILLGFSTGLGHINISSNGLILLLFSTFAFALGSVYASRADLPSSPLFSTSLQMIAGGSVMIMLGTTMGEWKDLNLEEISFTSWIAFLYLIFFGSIVGYTSFSWLLRVASPGQVSTYAYVNPVIAVFLGCFIGKEPLTKEVMIATPILIAAVILLIQAKRQHV